MTGVFSFMPPPSDFHDRDLKSQAKLVLVALSVLGTSVPPEVATETHDKRAREEEAVVGHTILRLLI